MKHCLILGTRPEIIKLSPVIRELKKRQANFFIIHSNQHYTKIMDEVFFKKLDLPKPKYNLNVGSHNQGEQTALILERAEKILLKEKPEVVYVQGDTNTVLAGALAAAKLGIAVAHVEAGLRSYDRTMPEEINRVIADHVSTYLFAPTRKQAEILEKEGIEKKRIFIVGNTIVDAVTQNLSIALKKSQIIKRLKLPQNKYFLITLHRPSNVDHRPNLTAIFKALESLYKRYKLPVIFPVHPRTKKQIERFKMRIPQGLIIIDPVNFHDMIFLEKNAKLILTDSGGVQEEACILKVPCVTLRENTERPETVEVRANLLVGSKDKSINKGVIKMIQSQYEWKNPFGKGESGIKIVNIIQGK